MPLHWNTGLLHTEAPATELLQCWRLGGSLKVDLVSKPLAEKIYGNLVWWRVAPPETVPWLLPLLVVNSRGID